jgi:hypothetical protein
MLSKILDSKGLEQEDALFRGLATSAVGPDNGSRDSNAH